MPIETLPEVIKKKTLYLKLKHELDGLTMTIQSDVLEKLFKANHKEASEYAGRQADTFATASSVIPNVAYRLTSSLQKTLSDLSCSRSLTWAEYGKDIYTDGMVNMSYLRVVGLTEGKTFRWNGVYPKPVIEAILTCYKEQAKEIYKNLIVCYDVELTVNIDKGE